jgi:hypothetical protein
VKLGPVEGEIKAVAKHLATREERTTDPLAVAAVLRGGGAGVQ